MLTVRRLIVLCALPWLVLGVTASAGQAKSGTPITACGQVVTTSAFLTGDLYCPGTAGIVVGASGITIDLKGHTLRGDRSPGHDGIDDSAGFDRVTVKNGVLSSFANGIYASDLADELGVSGVVSSGSSYGTWVVGDSASIRSSTFAGNTTGIRIFGASASVTGSTVVGNHNAGILVAGDALAVKSSTVSGNETGVQVDGNSTSVRASILSGNTFGGVAITGDSASVSASTVVGNGADGIRIFGEAAQIKGNRAEANGFSGGASDGAGLGIHVPSGSFTTTPPVGTNIARGNDDADECDPLWLC